VRRLYVDVLFKTAVNALNFRLVTFLSSSAHYITTPAIKHVNKFCGIPVFHENGDHAFIYLVAGVIN
jgi:hypothetical protein